MSGEPQDRNWSLVYQGYDPDDEGLREALCTLGNGYLATRGAAPDSPADGIHYPGTYLAGGYNRLVSEIAGRRIENEDLVNLPNWLPLTFRVDGGAWIRIDDVELVEYGQTLDVEHGVLHREALLRDGEGRTTRYRERRLLSMADPHIAALAVELTPQDWSGRLTVRSGIDGGVVNDGVARYRELANRHLATLERAVDDRDSIFLRSQTTRSRIQVALAARTRLYRGVDEADDVETASEKLDDGIRHDKSCHAERGKPITVEKIVALYTSRDFAIFEPGLEARQAAARAGRFDALRSPHELAWRHLWEVCDIELEERAAAETELKLRVHVFHLLQTVSPHSIDLDTGVPARGWHGEAYRGHIFWDELFIFPFLSLRTPTLTRSLLTYRHRRLPAARRAARDAGYAGAMFPWQSGSDGREETQRVHLNPKSGRWNPDNSHRQRHINSAIAYNIWKYYQATDDQEFLHEYGAEIFLEIARFWASIASYNAWLDRYEIKGVMGPDEYHTAYPSADPSTRGGIDNNAYVNVMASWVLTHALDIVALASERQCRRLCERIGFELDETDHWYDVSRKLRVPFHGDGLISQFEGYEDLEELDWEGYRERYGDIHRLDRILEAENDDVNRYKASKQADVLMLFYLFSADELRLMFEHLGYPFSPKGIPKHVDYYLARTSHGSTLSRVAHAWVLARADRRRSWHLFQQALDSDIADIQGGTTAEGIHTGAMAGTIDLVQRCYIGLEMKADVLHFDPVLPGDLRRLSVLLRYRRQALSVEIDHDTLRIGRLSHAPVPITVAYRAHYRRLAPGETCVFRLLKPEERDRGEPGRQRGAG